MQKLKKSNSYFDIVFHYAKKWQLFLKGQSRREQYLKIGDKVESTIISRDGKINLGRQSHVIKGQA